MDERKNNNHPWDDSVYGTGRTEPPKSHGGTVALLLILIIFLCGIITVLGVLNVRLFQKLNTRRESEQSISFATGAELPAETTALPTESIDATLGEDTPTIDLQKCPQGVENVPTEGALSLQKIYSRNIDSVVSITSTGQGTTATGTGVILTEDGYIVTNCHVVENGISITAQLTDGRTLPAMLVGADSVSDLAVLHIDTTGLTPAQFGDSDSLRVGDTVVAIGDPLGVKFRGTYTDGIISGIGRDMDMEGRTMTLIQTNAALNSGNSGGPAHQLLWSGHRHQHHEDRRVHRLRRCGGSGLRHSQLHREGGGRAADLSGLCLRPAHAGSGGGVPVLFRPVLLPAPRRAVYHQR